MTIDGEPDANGARPERASDSRLWRDLVVVLAAIAVIAAALVAISQPSTQPSSGGTACAPLGQEHAAWTSILSTYVRGGGVDYAGLHRSGRPDLDRYLRSLGSVCREQFDAWDRDQKLAFWINTYNASAVEFVLDHYPMHDIHSFGVLPEAAFREGFVALRVPHPGSYSLDEIEHEALQFGEARVHFALTSASKGAPALRSEAYRASALESQLTEATRGFVVDASKTRFDPASRTLSLSPIYRWFREDFERSADTIPAFVARYAEPSTAAALASGPVEIEYLEYDGSLNGR